ncbi:MAG: flagellar hook-basal body complex protein FliE [Bdellovibrionaceae bacterium]|nr:flagellar hook-basal body complex protein FliE [Pseudobdellovibrionaceae bacterium]
MDGLHIKSTGAAGGINTGALSNIKNKPISTQESQGVSFGETLKEAIHKVNDMQQTADVKMQQLATGETTDIADVKIAAEKADIALRLMTSVRNKMIDAYNEIMKMQV